MRFLGVHGSLKNNFYSNFGLNSPYAGYFPMFEMPIYLATLVDGFLNKRCQ